jgi:hypothetical protein
MPASTPEQIHRLFEEAFNAGDLDGLIRKSTMSRQAAAPGAAQRSRVQAVDACRLRRRAAE